MGINRSPTSAWVAERLAKERGLDIKMSFGGFDKIPNDKSDDELRKHFEQYDLIIVMEGYMRRGLVKLGIQRKNIRCLEIPDNYKRDEPVLVDILRESLKLYVRE